MSLLAGLVADGLLPAPGPGLSDAALDQPIIVGAEEAAILARYGIAVWAPGTRCRVLLKRDQAPIELRVSFEGATDGLLIVGRSAAFAGQVNLRGRAAVCCFAGVSAHPPNRVRVDVDGNRACAWFGLGTSFVDAQFLLEGDGRKLVIGDDCMISWGVFARNYDSHSIVELASGAVLNTPTDLIIGAHVWIGQDVLIAKGVTIGGGSIVGARSTVTADIPARVAAVGSPARVVREGVSWTRERYADAAAIDRMRAMLAGL